MRQNFKIHPVSSRAYEYAIQRLMISFVLDIHSCAVPLPYRWIATKRHHSIKFKMTARSISLNAFPGRGSAELLVADRFLAEDGFVAIEYRCAANCSPRFSAEFLLERPINSGILSLGGRLRAASMSILLLWRGSAKSSGYGLMLKGNAGPKLRSRRCCRHNASFL
jgi:hypothetical protein